MTFPVNEIFRTIQGEAFWTGTPSLFVRLQGCDVGCPWCDTKHTWHIDQARQITEEQMRLKGHLPNDFYAMLTGPQIVVIAIAERLKHIVITGGEPADHDLGALTATLNHQGFTTQIETSGTAEIRVSDQTWVTLSPKVGMPGGLHVRDDALLRANEIKMPVGKPADIATLDKLLLISEPQYVWLQPLSMSAKATALCVDAAMASGRWRVSAQVHRFLDLR